MRSYRLMSQLICGMMKRFGDTKVTVAQHYEYTKCHWTLSMKLLKWHFYEIIYIHCNIKMFKSLQHPSLLCCQTHQYLTPNEWSPGQRRQRHEAVFTGGISLRRTLFKPWSQLLGDGVARNLFLALKFCWPVIHSPGLLAKWGQCHQPSTCFRNLVRNRLHFSDPSLLTSAFWTRRKNTTT